MTDPDCPGQDDLLAFHRGDLRDAAAEAVAIHLEGCAACEARLRELDASETAVVGLLREGPTPEETADLPPKGHQSSSVIVGPYKIVEPLGEGGMGAVFMAQQSEPVRRLVALKLIKPGMDSRQVLARFEAERQALALMDHPNIAKVFDAGTTPAGRPYFAMELVKGTPITQYCDDHRLSVRDRLELFVPVCRAVQHAHQKGIIHRDIKPSNVLVARYDGVAVPKVIDFGIAKAIGQPLTERTLVTNFGAVVGTPEYMAPEQAELNQVDVDTRCDVYALGVLLYEILTGSTPLTRQKLGKAAMLEVLRMVREDEAEKPSARLSSSETLASLAATRQSEPARLTSLMRGDLDWVTLRALEKDRDRRYDSAAALARDVERYLGDEAVEAAPPSASYRLHKFARRHRGALRSILAAAALLVAATAVSAWQAIRAMSAEREAVVQRDEAKKSLGRAVAAERDANLRRDEAGKALAKAVAEEKRAETALARALDEEAHAKVELEFRDVAINFCKELLAMCRPAGLGGGLGVDIKLSEAIDAAVERIGPKFDGKSELESNLRRDLGNTYYYRKEYPKALAQYQKAYEMNKARSGADDLETLDYGRSVALAHLGRNNVQAAIPLLEDALPAYRAAYGPEGYWTLNVHKTLAEARARPDLVEDATRIWGEILGIRRWRRPYEAASDFYNVDLLAQGHQRAGRLREASRLLEEYLPLSRANLGARHPRTLDLANRLGQCYKDLGRLGDAIPLLREAADGHGATNGPADLRTTLALDDLAKACQEAGDHAEAVRIGEANLATLRAKQGPNGLGAMIAAIDLGHYYQGAGRSDEAIRLMQEAIGLQKAKSGPDHLFTVLMEGWLARVALRADRPELARPLVADMVAQVGDRPTPDSLVLAERLALIGGDLLDRGRPEEAEAPLRACLAIRQRHSPGHWLEAVAQSTLGAALAARKEASPFEAERLLRGGYEGLRTHQADIPPRGRGNLPLSLDRLVRFAESAGRPAEVARWKAERAKYPAEAGPPSLR